MDLLAILQVLITNPVTVIFAAAGVILIALAIIGQIPPINVQGKRAIFLGVFGGLLILTAIGVSWLLAEKNNVIQISASVFQEENGLVVMEAEHFTDARPGAGNATSTKWQPITNISGYSGVSALQALPDDGIQPENYANGPALLYDIEFNTPGTYYVFIRGLAPDNVSQGGDEFDSNDSVHVGINGEAVTTGEGIGLTGFGPDSFTWQRHYADKDTSIVIQQPGRYTFYLWMREDGIVIDKILLSTETDVISNSDKGFGPKESSKTP
jgi:hypothetical protein